MASSAWRFFGRTNRRGAPQLLAVARVRRGRTRWPARPTPLRCRILPIDLSLPCFGQRISASDDGVIRFRPTEAGRVSSANVSEAEVNLLAAEQSNSSLTIGDMAMLKIYRRISPGQHPEAEMNRYLTAQGFIARAVAAGRRGSCCGGRHSVHAGDRTANSSATRATPGRGCWITSTRALDALAPAAPPRIRGGSVRRLRCRFGRRSAGGWAKCMRFWRARHPDPRSRRNLPMQRREPVGQRKPKNAFKRRLRPSLICNVGARQGPGTRTEAFEPARRHRGRGAQFVPIGRGNVEDPYSRRLSSGQVLVASGDAFIIDFEGEPAASIAERRAKTESAARCRRAASFDRLCRRHNDGQKRESAPCRWMRTSAMNSSHNSARAAVQPSCSAYWERPARENGPAERALLGLFLIEKAAYEVDYEAANRPTWMGVPIAGLARLAARIRGKRDRRP